MRALLNFDCEVLSVKLVLAVGVLLPEGRVDGELAFRVLGLGEDVFIDSECGTLAALACTFCSTRTFLKLEGEGLADVGVR